MERKKEKDSKAKERRGKGVLRSVRRGGQDEKLSNSEANGRNGDGRREGKEQGRNRGDGERAGA